MLTSENEAGNCIIVCTEYPHILFEKKNSKVLLDDACNAITEHPRIRVEKKLDFYLDHKTARTIYFSDSSGIQPIYGRFDFAIQEPYTYQIGYLTDSRSNFESPNASRFFESIRIQELTKTMSAAVTRRPNKESSGPGLRISDPAAGFEFQLPNGFESPSRTIDSNETSNGGVVEVRYVSQRDSSGCRLDCTRGPMASFRKFTDNAAVLAATLDGILKTGHWTVDSWKDAMIAGKPGKRLYIESAIEGVSAFARWDFAVSEPSIYEIGYFSTNLPELDSPAVLQYFNSIKLLPNSPDNTISNLGLLISDPEAAMQFRLPRGFDPPERETSDSSVDGHDRKSVTLSTRNARGSVVVNSTMYPREAFDLRGRDSLLLDLRNATLEAVNGEIDSTAEFIGEGYRGQTVFYLSRSGGEPTRARFEWVVAEPFVYQIGFLARESADLYKPEIGQFFESFKFGTPR